MPHIHEKIDFTVETFIVYKDKVLLRKHNEYKIWLSVGGHIKLDEDPTEAAIRKAREEAGLHTTLFCNPERETDFKAKEKSLIPPEYLNRHHITETHEHVTFIYFATSETDQFKLPEGESTNNYRWFTKEELIKNDYGIPEATRFYALKTLEKLTF